MPTLVEKLADIAKTIPNLLRQGDNGEYKWLRAVDVFDAIRFKLFEARILIYPFAQKTTREQPYLNVAGNVIDEVRVEVLYRITDGVSEIECSAHGIGRDYEGKALYMASTGAKKDLLKSLFLIAGYEDDSESVQDTARLAPDLSQKIAEMEAKIGPDIREWPIGIQGAIAWNSACRSTGIHESAKKAFLKKMGVKVISELKRKDAELAMQWALGKAEVSLGENAQNSFGERQNNGSDDQEV